MLETRGLLKALACFTFAASISVNEKAYLISVHLSSDFSFFNKRRSSHMNKGVQELLVLHNVNNIKKVKHLQNKCCSHEFSYYNYV